MRAPWPALATSQVFDRSGRGFLDHAQTQQALGFLVPQPKDGSPKPLVNVACPAHLYTEAGDLQLPWDWFATLYRTMQ